MKIARRFIAVNGMSYDIIVPSGRLKNETSSVPMGRRGSSNWSRVLKHPAIF